MKKITCIIILLNSICYNIYCQIELDVLNLNRDEILENLSTLISDPGSNYCNLDTAKNGIKEKDFNHYLFLKDATTNSDIHDSQIVTHAAIFRGNVNLSETTFNKVVHLGNSYLLKHLTVTRSNFTDLKIHRSYLLNGAHFFLTKVNDRMLFQRNICLAGTSNGVFFKGTEFGTLVDFTGSMFDKAPTFDKIILPDTVILDYIYTPDEIDLTNVELYNDGVLAKEKCVISLKNVASKINLTYDKFKLFEPTHPNVIEFNEVSNQYTFLLKNLQNRGYDTKQLVRDYKKFLFLKDPTHGRLEKKWNFFLNWLDSTWWDYQFNKVRIVLWTCIFMILFSVFNYLFRMKVVDAYKLPSITDHIDKKHSLKQFSLMLCYTGLVFFGIKLSIENMNFEKRMTGVLYIFFQYSLGLICLAYLINLLIDTPQAL